MVLRKGATEFLLVTQEARASVRAETGEDRSFFSANEHTHRVSRDRSPPCVSASSHSRIVPELYVVVACCGRGVVVVVVVVAGSAADETIFVDEARRDSCDFPASPGRPSCYPVHRLQRKQPAWHVSIIRDNKKLFRSLVFSVTFLNTRDFDRSNRRLVCADSGSSGGGGGGRGKWLEKLVKVERICSFLGVFLFFTRRLVFTHNTVLY